MSLLNGGNGKDKKKGGQPATKPGAAPVKSKTNTKAVAKTTRVTGRAQRGS